MGNFSDLSGRRFGRLEVLSGDRVDGRWRWHCRCDCGSLPVIDGRALTRSEKPTRSCGCLLAEIERKPWKHGHAVGGKRSRTLRIWTGMLDRCLNPNNSNYPNYGGRGITVCRRWMLFVNFLADMGEAPPGLSIDRIRNNGPYTPSNCRWASALEQARNSRQCLAIKIGDVTLPLSVWCEQRGVEYFRAYSRIIKRGWTPERALAAGT